MIRTVVTAEKSVISISVPETYIGKKIEVIAFAADELQDDTLVSKVKPKMKPSDYRGSISKEFAEQLHVHVQQSRNEWE